MADMDWAVDCISVAAEATPLTMPLTEASKVSARSFMAFIFLDPGALFRLFLSGFKPLDLDGVVLEHLHHRHHVPDFIVTVPGRDGGVELSLRKPGHGIGHGDDRVGQRTGQRKIRSRRSARFPERPVHIIRVRRADSVSKASASSISAMTAHVVSPTFRGA